MTRAAGGVLLAVVLVLTGTAPVAALRSPAPEERQRELSEEIERLREQVDEAAAEEADVLAELEVTRKTRAELDAMVAELDRATAGAAADLATAEDSVAAAVRRHRRAQADLDRARARLGEARRTLEDQAVSSFMRYGVNTGPLEVLLQVRDLHQLHEVSGFIAAVAASQAEVVRRYQHEDQSTRELEVRAEQTRQEAAATRDAVAEHHRAVAATRTQKSEALAGARREEAREQELLAEVRESRTDYEQRITNLRAESASVTELLRTRQAEQEAAAVAAATTSTTTPGQAPVQAATTTSAPRPVTPARSATLAYPVANPVITSRYGYRTHPIFGTSRLHAGIDLRAATGTSILASADGVVVSAGPRGGYGNTIIVDHGGSLATLYAHQSRLYVGAGATVRRGQAIGAAGSTGYSTGPHLHFEVRVDGTPVDPLNYL